jgi:hypothetical protein
MAIIYTYPVKATPNANDLILISDSQDSNKTKQVKISTLPGGSGSGVSSVTSANAAITVADPSTTPVLTSVAYSGGTNIGHVPTGSGSSAAVYLDGTGNWSTPSGSGGDTYTLQAEAKSGTSVPLKLDAATGTDSTVNLKEGTNITLTRNSATEIEITAAGGGYTLPLATNNVRGGVKVAGLTRDVSPLQAPSTDASRDYQVQINTNASYSEQLFVNIPWTDNVAYSAGTGLSLTGATFANTDLGSSQNIYKNFAATSGGTAVANTNNDTLTLSAGSGITTTRSGDTITIAATGGSAATGGQTPVDYAVSTGFEATGGSVQYFYIFTCHGNFTLNRMYWYQNTSASQVVTWAIYQGDLSSATLLGQGSATATQTAVNYVTMTAEEGQNLSLVKGTTYVIGHQQGGQNGSVACLTSANPNSGLAVTHAGASGFPASFPGAELTYTATGIRPCVSLVP